MSEWRTLDWLPLWEISDEGQVRRLVSSRRVNAGFIATQFLVRGYPKVTLTVEKCRKRCVFVHRLVCEAYHGPAPSESHQVAHFDGVKTNNRASNLRWATPQENQDDRIRHGTTIKGELCFNAKLTEADVREIRANYSGRRGEAADLARHHGLTLSAMHNVIRGRIWRHVT